MHWFNFKACNISQISEILTAERRLECRKGEDRVLNWHRGVGNRNTACVHMHLIIPFPLNHWSLAATDHARCHTSSQCHVTSHHHLSNNWKQTSQQHQCVSSLAHFPLVTSKAFHVDHHQNQIGVRNAPLVFSMKEVRMPLLSITCWQLGVGPPHRLHFNGSSHTT